MNTRRHPSGSRRTAQQTKKGSGTAAREDFRITPEDPDFERQMALARKVMKDLREMLRKLAK